MVTEQAASDLIRLAILGGFKGPLSFLTTVSVSQFILYVFCQLHFSESMFAKKQKQNMQFGKHPVMSQRALIPSSGLVFVPVQNSMTDYWMSDLDSATTIVKTWMG